MITNLKIEQHNENVQFQHIVIPEKINGVTFRFDYNAMKNTWYYGGYHILPVSENSAAYRLFGYKWELLYKGEHVRHFLCLDNAMKYVFRPIINNANCD